MAQSATGPSLPAAPERTPGLPENSLLLRFQGFSGGLNTKPPRAAVPDQEAPWIDNLMPIGENDLRAVPDKGAAFYTASGMLTIPYFDWFGLSPAGVNTGPHAIVFLSDGSAVDVMRDAPGTITTIAPAATFSPPANTFATVRQYGTKYLLIATVQADSAFWIWDGSVFYAPGTLGPDATITDGGINYASAPTVSFVGGSGAGATATAQVDASGAVTGITITNPGTLWVATDPQTILVRFTGGGGGTSAYGSAAVVNGAIVAVDIQNGGSGFTSVPAITFTGGGGSGAVAVVDGLTDGIITSIRVTACGSGYDSSVVIGTSGGGGSGLIAAPRLDRGVINGATITAGGGPYLSAPKVVFFSATGSGAAATAILNASGVVTGIDFGLGAGAGFTGSGYSGSVVIGFTGGDVASGTIRLMPFGINGRSIETYQSRTWITTTLHGAKTFGTAPGSAENFSPSDGGFVFPPTDSFLRYQITALRQANGFLYEVADSSVNYISGVQTSGSPVLTTFSNLNVDPQIGSPWRDSVEVYSRAIMIANPFGVHAIYGGAVQKVSTPLDGVYQSGTIDPDYPPSSAVAEVFGVHVFVFLMPITDPISGAARRCLFMWDGKRWWAASQSATIKAIRTMEWGSQIVAYGNTGTVIYPLFQTGSTSTTKTLQSKLWTQPSIMVKKRAMQLYALWKSYAASTLNFSVQTEGASVNVTQGAFVSAGSGQVAWARSRIPDNLGVCIGFQMTSTGADFSLTDVMLLCQERRLEV